MAGDTGWPIPGDRDGGSIAADEEESVLRVLSAVMHNASCFPGTKAPQKATYIMEVRRFDDMAPKVGG